MIEKYKGQNLVFLPSVIPNLVLDIRYATPCNFLQEKVYTSALPFLTVAAAESLKNASDQFNSLGYSIKIWDCYRPWSVQRIFWERVPDERYVADPQKGSRHNRGCAVDLTLVDSHGDEIFMGTDFDDFSQKAHRDYTDLPIEVIKNRKLLQEIMEKNRFIGWENEWWHFDFEDWQRYPLLDISFEALEQANNYCVSGREKSVF